MPEGSEQIPVEGGPGGSNMSSNMSIASPCLTTRRGVKHIDNRHHACKEQVQLGNVSYKFCASATNIADCLTKAIPRAALEFQRASMGLRPLQLTMASQ